MSSSSKYSVAEARSSKLAMRAELLLLTEYDVLYGLLLKPPRNAVSIRTTPLCCRKIRLFEIIRPAPTESAEVSSLSGAHWKSAAATLSHKDHSRWRV